MASLNTSNPNALRYLLNETLYSFEITPTTSPTAPPYIFLGENKKNFLFILHHEQDAFFSALALDAFSKTIAALGYTLADVAVYNLASSAEDIKIDELLLFFDPKKLVFSGASPLSLGLKEQPMNTVFQQGNSSCLFTYSFEEMLSDTQKKKIFWSLLKTV